MLSEANKIYNNLYGLKGSGLSSAMKLGDWQGTKDILQKGREWIINELKSSALTGRGGAGFSVGMKWSFLNINDPRDKYLVINADEGEPGTCKDREILRHEPHKLLEGIAIAAFTLGVKTAYIYLRGEYIEMKIALEKAISEAKAQGFVGTNALNMFDLEIYVHMGAGAYICGEETALLESLEGKPGRPRNKPPFPANSGLYNCPTVINNVESIASVATILKRGASWFNSNGRSKTKGSRIFAISGLVNKPCIFEEEIGVPIKELVDTYAHGVTSGWDNLQAIIPGGVSAQILNKQTCDTMIMDPKSLQEAGSTIGTACMVVFDNSVNLFDVFTTVSKFYMDESCGQCTPCREGSGWTYRLVKKINEGNASKEDLEILNRVINNIQGKTICGLGDAINMAIGGFYKAFTSKINDKVNNI